MWLNTVHMILGSGQHLGHERNFCFLSQAQLRTCILTSNYREGLEDSWAMNQFKFSL